MGRNKLKRFEENAARPNVFEPRFGERNPLRGHWAVHHFEQEAPLVLELACGRGEYTVGLAALYPEKNFIGIDVKGSRIWYGSGEAIEKGLTNAAFLRTRINMLDQHFAENEVDEIWLVHPDPRPRDRDERRRLTHPKYLNTYKQILKSGGWLKLKTDNDLLYAYSLEILSNFPGVQDLSYTDDLYHSPLLEEHHGIKTKYERKFTEEGLTIKYLKCRLFA